ncbi:T9SS C-terminal target domain-containing protein [candidate division KSB1 bacterium]|nr:T9SS type A sorting domain-containing protein [candidate division KSB1 bacterium]RQW06772.1 MAG: T9SS C-terminal target domain-containing protein [candidate division KSB1 bacterium]
MKNRLFILLLFVPFACGADWEIVSPMPAPFDFRDLFFLNQDTGWVVGDAGAIYKTTDGGGSWQQLNTPTREELHCLYFFDELNGWIGGGANYDAQLFRTTDGGESWRRVSLPISTKLLALTFVNSQLGFAGNTHGHILRTTDGGESWQSQRLKWDEIYRISFANERVGWITTGYGVLKTTDGGETWSDVSPGPAIDTKALYVFSENAVIVGGYADYVHKTVDGGKTWDQYSLPFKKTMTAMAFYNDSVGTAVSWGNMMRTTDGGRSWEATDYLTGSENIIATGPNRALICGLRGELLLTNDMGLTWRDAKKGMTKTLTALQFNGESGWIVGCNGSILNSMDGGATWQEQVSGTTADLTDIDLNDPSSGWIVGSHGTVLHLLDGRTQLQHHVGEAKINAVSSPAPDSVWLCSENGSIWFSGTAGDQWKQQFCYTNMELCDIQLVGHCGWCVGGWGDRSIILATRDGGQCWTEQKSPLTCGVRDLCFIDRQHGWLIGDDDGYSARSLAKTCDGGETWYFITEKYMGAPQAVFFSDPLFGWIVYAGIILSTADGGLSWQEYQTGVYSTLWDIFFAQPNRGWAVGEQGLILRWEDEHQNPPPEPISSRIRIFPNPANASTHVTFFLPQEKKAAIFVCNAKGQRLQTLHEGRLPAGEHIFHFDTQNYASGVYWVRARTAHSVEAERFTIVR